MIYPELNEKVDICCLNKVSKRVVDLWDRLPVFRDNMEKVAAQVRTPVQNDTLTVDSPTP